MSATPSVIIIGAGLCGLTTAYRLQEAGIESLILEARDRPGGRIETVRNAQGAPVEMGATWLGKKHVAVNTLLAELGLTVSEQYLGEYAIYEPLSTSPPQLVRLPPNDEPSYRIAGGSTRLIERLLAGLPVESIRYGEVVTAVHAGEDALTVRTAAGRDYRAAYVVSTLPPRLAVRSITLEPAWPPALLRVARTTHTWMGESIKVGFTYARPFWRTEGLSGTLFSNVGPVSELYDHSDPARNHYALKGFLNGTYHTLSPDDRRDLVLDQLSRYYGDAAARYLTYEERVWRNEPFTFSEYDAHVLPHQHNGDPLYAEPLHGGRFFLGGAETAGRFPGYMDGAVNRGEDIARRIMTTRF